MAMAAFGSVQAQDMSRGDADKQQQKKENMSVKTATVCVKNVRTKRQGQQQYV